LENPQFVDVNGVRTRYFAAGAGEPVILVHGGHYGLRSSAIDWELNFDRLAETHKVIAFDKLGMGFTDNPQNLDDYNIESNTAHLMGLMDALGLERAHLVGHSRGGYPVTRLSIDHPDRVRTLTVVSSSSVTNPFNPIYATWREKAATMEERAGVRYLIEANSYSDAHITDTLVDVGVEISRLDKTAVAAGIMVDGQYDRFKADLLERVEVIKSDITAGRLTVPTLIMWGFNDPSATIERCGKPAIDLFFPSVEVCEMHILNHAGHYCFREQVEAFNDTLLAFYARARRAVGV
jgi:2-hydroxy-6-oxo-6-(2'-carboxyphenyl)-hexa-2,4-dienoate hydrolase